MERELAKEKLSGSDSDELVPIRNSMGGAGTLSGDYSYVFHFYFFYPKIENLFLRSQFIVLKLALRCKRTKTKFKFLKLNQIELQQKIIGIDILG